MPDAVAVGTVLAVARDRAVDEARVRRGERRVVDPEAGGDAGTEALEHDVGIRREPAEDVAPGGVLQVEPHAALVAGEERHADAEGIVGRGDRQHVGPEVGEERRAEGARELTREVENADVRERRHGAAYRLVARGVKVRGEA